MRIKPTTPIHETGDIYYDIFQGGYLKFADYLEEPELTRALEAVQFISNFVDTLENKDLIQHL